MPDAISNTSPLVYTYRIGILDWWSQLFSNVWIPQQVIDELQAGQNYGYDVPTYEALAWAEIVEPRHMPQEWFALDLGLGEVAAMSVALDYPERILVLDDLLARRTAQTAGLHVWGTLRILLEAKSQRLTPEITPYVEKLQASGMYMSEAIKRRVLHLAGE